MEVDKEKTWVSNIRNAKCFPKQDTIAWGTSMLFIITLLGCMWAWGIVEGWNAQSGYYYESVNNTQERFLPEPFGCNDTSVPGRNSGECTTTWYFWKKPPLETSAVSHAVVWLFYCLHQIFMWTLIYRAQLIMSYRKKGSKKYEPRLRWFNWSLLFINATFHIIHLVQTHWTYDGIAQDVSVSSSQASVIMMICFILLMEYKDRGFMLMWPNPRSDDKFAKYLRLHPAPIELIRKYHGIAFSWASIYTFWYHPMENTWGHTLGFFHTAIVLLQGSLIYTDMHLNRYWRLLNEVWVLVHGTLVAIQTSDPMKAGGSSAWPIFAFGFGFVLAFTQIFSLPLWKNLRPYFRIIPALVYFAIVLALCGTVVQGLQPDKSGFSRIYEMFFIAGEEYMMLLFSWLFIYIFVLIETSCMKNASAPVDGVVSATKQAVYLGCVIFIYAIFILISYLSRHFTFNFLIMMIIFVFIFSFGVSITVLLLKQITGPFRMVVHKSKTSPNKCDSAVDNAAYVAE